MKKQDQYSRRQFMTYAVVSSSVLLFPNLARPSPMGMVGVIGLHAARFVGGLITSTFKSVVVQLASDHVVDAIKNEKPNRQDIVRRYGSDISTCSQNQCNDGGQFRHTNYKVSIIILGNADYKNNDRQLELLLLDRSQTNRFKTTIDYLRDEDIRVRLSGMEYSHKVGLDTEPNDLFDVNYFAMEKNEITHYKNLINYTGTKAFNNWT